MTEHKASCWLKCAPLLLALATASCASNVEPGVDAGPATFTEIYALLFPAETNPRCNSCHSMPASNASNGHLHMGMDQATAYAALVGQVSTSLKCGGMNLVTPGDPEMSLFYLKLTPTPPCGYRMPNGGRPLSNAQLQRVHSWISAGALDD